MTDAHYYIKTNGAIKNSCRTATVCLEGIPTILNTKVCQLAGIAAKNSIPSSNLLTSRSPRMWDKLRRKTQGIILAEKTISIV